MQFQLKDKVRFKPDAVKIFNEKENNPYSIYLGSSDVFESIVFKEGYLNTDEVFQVEDVTEDAVYVKVKGIAGYWVYPECIEKVNK